MRQWLSRVLMRLAVRADRRAELFQAEPVGDVNVGTVTCGCGDPGCGLPPYVTLVLFGRAGLPRAVLMAPALAADVGRSLVKSAAVLEDHHVPGDRA